MSEHIIWTDEPLILDSDIEPGSKKEEHTWEKFVYAIGNGRLGCTAFGEPRRERIQFNQESLWVGNEDNTGGYQPFGDVYVDMPHEQFSDYRRELDIQRAVQTISYRSGGVNYRREYFASYPAQAIVLRFTADKPGSLSGTVSMGNIHDVPITSDANTLVMQGDDTSQFYLWQLQLNEPKRLRASREYTSDKNINLSFEARLAVQHQGGVIDVSDCKVTFAGCDSLTLLLAAETNYVADRAQGWTGEHPHEKVLAQINAASDGSYEELLDEHISDYQSLYKRVAVDFGKAPADLAVRSTPERVKAYGAAVEAGEQSPDRGLEALLYQFGRYLMIASSRDGHNGLPSNLQGLWLIGKHPSWRCDYHTDVNVQMNYWLTGPGNICECFPPLAHWIDSIREVRKEETRRVLGVESGWLMRSENGIFGGSTWHIQKGDSAWLCQNLWDHYAFTQDKEYLERYAYPVMKEISEFWVDHLMELPDGTLVAPEGRSPEHGPVGVDGVTYDQVLCWDLFTNTIDSSEALDADAEFREELREKRSRLLGPTVGRWGQLQEWMEDIDDPDDDHRHINHLICVYPGRQVHPAIDAEIAEAARVSVTARRDHGAGHPGWSRVWKACMFGRLLDGDSAHEQLAGNLASKIYGNLWAVHPPFQIDANFGYSAGVHEMLVQSHVGAIHMLPALPSAWPAGSVTGLRVRGGYEVDMEWKDGDLVKATLRGVCNTAATCKVQYGDKTTELSIAKGEECALEVTDFSA